jgi:hypothetical protein
MNAEQIATQIFELTSRDAGFLFSQLTLTKKVCLIVHYCWYHEYLILYSLRIFDFGEEGGTYSK